MPRALMVPQPILLRTLESKNQALLDAEHGSRAWWGDGEPWSPIREL